MSIFLPVHAECGRCGHEARVQLAASVNADRRPDLRQAILDGTFQALACPGCGNPIRLPAHLSYLDIGRGQWILVEDPERLDDWPGAEAEALALFEATYGGDAPPPAQELGAALHPRLVFGWPALREKLVCHDLALDDVILELLKTAILRHVPAPPFGDATELRLHAGDADTLGFTWIATPTEAELATLRVPREVYGALVSDPLPWASLRGAFDTRAYVDLQRLFRVAAP